MASSAPTGRARTSTRRTTPPSMTAPLMSQSWPLVSVKRWATKWKACQTSTSPPRSPRPKRSLIPLQSLSSSTTLPSRSTTSPTRAQLRSNLPPCKPSTTTTRACPSAARAKMSCLRSALATLRPHIASTRTKRKRPSKSSRPLSQSVLWKATRDPNLPPTSTALLLVKLPCSDLQVPRKSLS